MQLCHWAPVWESGTLCTGSLPQGSRSSDRINRLTSAAILSLIKIRHSSPAPVFDPKAPRSPYRRGWSAHLRQNWSRRAPSLSCLLWLTTTPPAAKQAANANYFRLSSLACNSSHLQLCDNDAAKHAIRRTSRQTPTAQLPLGGALDMAQLPGAPDAHRTGRNIDIADPFSRHDMSLPTQHGWVVLRPDSCPL